MAYIRAKRRDRVLDVGSGHFPHSTADVLVDRYLEDVLDHRSHKPMVKDRAVVCADIAALPFKEGVFDYVVCNQVLEHVEDPAMALRELARVGKKGFLAVPSELQEFICPTEAHRWVFALRKTTLLIKPKSERHAWGRSMFGGVFHVLYRQTDFRRLAYKRPQLFAVRLEWEGSIEFELFSPDSSFFDYNDEKGIVWDLVQPTPADTWVESVKRWFQIYLDLDNMYRLTRLRSRVRRLFKRR